MSQSQYGARHAEVAACQALPMLAIAMLFTMVVIVICLLLG